MERTAAKESIHRTPTMKKTTPIGAENVGHDLPATDKARGEDWNHRLANHRRRQASVSTILDQTFGQLASCSPDLWERRLGTAGRKSNFLAIFIKSQRFAGSAFDHAYLEKISRWPGFAMP